MKLDKNGRGLSAFVTQYSENNTFKGILLNEGLNDQANFICTKKQFFQAMVDIIKRLFPEDVLLSSAKVLNVQLWPEDEGERLLYGDKEVAFVAKLGSHPFMTSTRRGEGVRLRWTRVDGGGGSSP